MSPVTVPGTMRSLALAFGGLTRKQEGLRIGSLAADFERSEVLVPLAVGNQRMGFNPNSKRWKHKDAGSKVSARGYIGRAGFDHNKFAWGKLIATAGLLPTAFCVLPSAFRILSIRCRRRAGGRLFQVAR
jgi:hypothetical protein